MASATNMTASHWALSYAWMAADWLLLKLWKLCSLDCLLLSSLISLSREIYCRRSSDLTF